MASKRYLSTYIDNAKSLVQDFIGGIEDAVRENDGSIKLNRPVGRCPSCYVPFVGFRDEDGQVMCVMMDEGLNYPLSELTTENLGELVEIAFLINNHSYE